MQVNQENWFKALNKDTNNWHWCPDSTFKFHKLIGLNIDMSIRCRMITDVFSTEVCEYDCYIYKDIIQYMYYNKIGILMVTFLSFTHDQPLPDCEATNDDLFFKEFDKFQYVGNLHEGKEVILENIRKLNNV